jgi:hypothetical protein
MLLLSNTIEVEVSLWKKMSAALPPHTGGAVQFHAVRSRGSFSQGRKTVIVRYGNELQKRNVVTVCVNILQTSVLVYLNHLKLEKKKNVNDQISLSVLAGVQALVRVSMTEDVDHVLVRFCRTSLPLGKYVLGQLDEMYLTSGTAEKKKRARGEELVRRLADEVVLMEKSSRQGSPFHRHKQPCRPASSSTNLRRQPPRRNHRQFIVKRSASALVGDFKKQLSSSSIEVAARPNC